MSNEERVALDTIILEEPELAAAKYPYAQTLNALNALYAPDAERARASVFDTRAETVVAPPPAESSSESVSRAGALARKAREAAEAHACASALAGHASESDDYMDVGLAIGKAPEANASSVLKALGLGDVLRGVDVRVFVYLCLDLRGREGCAVTQPFIGNTLYGWSSFLLQLRAPCFYFLSASGYTYTELLYSV